MDIDLLRLRVETLLEQAKQVPTIQLQLALHTGTLSLLETMYGPKSSQSAALEVALTRIRGTGHPGNTSILRYSIDTIAGVLANLSAELTAGYVGSLRASLTGDVLSDLIKLAKSVLEETTQDSTNVGAVLAAAAFEDTLRRLAETRGLAHRPKLTDTITDLKNDNVLRGPQVGIAQSYLSFRNHALHAKWEAIDRAATLSCLAFTEELLLRHFV